MTKRVGYEEAPGVGLRASVGHSTTSDPPCADANPLQPTALPTLFTVALNASSGLGDALGWTGPSGRRGRPGAQHREAVGPFHGVASAARVVGVMWRQLQGHCRLPSSDE